jgi:hypothetical protein
MAATKPQARRIRMSEGSLSFARRIDDALAYFLKRSHQAAHTIRDPLAGILAAYEARTIPEPHDVVEGDAWALGILAMLDTLPMASASLVKDLADERPMMRAMILTDDPRAYVVAQVSSGRAVFEMLIRPEPRFLPSLHSMIASPHLSPAQKAECLLIANAEAATVLSQHLYGGAGLGETDRFYVRGGRHTDDRAPVIIDRSNDRPIRPPVPIVQLDRLAAILNDQTDLADAYAATSRMVDVMRAGQSPSLPAALAVHGQMHAVLLASLLD